MTTNVRRQIAINAFCIFRLRRFDFLWVIIDRIIWIYTILSILFILFYVFSFDREINIWYNWFCSIEHFNSLLSQIMKVIISIALVAMYLLPIQAHAFNSRTSRFCENHYIGTQYNPKLEKTCRSYWISFSNQILNIK